MRCANGCDTYDCYPETERTPVLCRNCWERYRAQFQIFGAWCVELALSGVETPYIQLRRGAKIKLSQREKKELRKVQQELGSDDLTTLIVAARVAKTKLRDARRRSLARDVEELRAELGLAPLESVVASKPHPPH
jgi:lipoate synthase